jgi:hypothetical protein
MEWMLIAILLGAQPDQTIQLPVQSERRCVEAEEKLKQDLLPEIMALAGQQDGRDIKLLTTCIRVED